MMNKMKSAGVHLVKFLFILPLVAVLLLAFRNQYRLEEQFDDTLPKDVNTTAVIPVIRIDTVPAVTVANSKGYYIDVIGVNGECTVVVKDKNGRQVEKVMLNEWKEESKYEEKYGEILPPPPARPAVPAKPAIPSEPSLTTEPMAPTPPAIPAKPTSVGCGTGNGIATLVPSKAVNAVGHGNHLRGIATSYEITDHLATINLKDGTTEKYDLKKPEDKAKFESKYGKIITTSAGTGVSPVIVAGKMLPTTTVAPTPGTAIIVDEDYVYNISGDEDVLVRITPNTKKEELDKFISQLKQKGIDLSFNEIEYDSKGKLILISGRMKSNDGVSNFVANDFEVLILAMIKKKDKTLFTVSTKEQREPI